MPRNVSFPSFLLPFFLPPFLISFCGLKQSSCFSPPDAGITGVCYYARPCSFCKLKCGVLSKWSMHGITPGFCPSEKTSLLWGLIGVCIQIFQQPQILASGPPGLHHICSCTWLDCPIEQPVGPRRERSQGCLKPLTSLQQGALGSWEQDPRVMSQHRRKQKWWLSSDQICLFSA